MKTTMGAVTKLATPPLTRRVAMASLLGLAEHLGDEQAPENTKAGNR